MTCLKDTELQVSSARTQQIAEEVQGRSSNRAEAHMLAFLNVSKNLSAGFELVWEVLGRDSAQLFGLECGSTALWTMGVLVLRALCQLAGVNQYIPPGLIFSAPILMQLFLKMFPLLDIVVPNLNVRAAESVLGRVHPTKLAVVFPAHFMGSIIGCTVLKMLLPFLPSEVFMPEMYSSGLWIEEFVREVVVNFFFVSFYLVVPELLEVNGFSRRWLTLFALPFVFVGVPDKGSTFSPAISYALWYVTHESTKISVEVQTEHLAGPMVGALIAGVVCAKFFPDDPFWRRK